MRPTCNIYYCLQDTQTRHDIDHSISIKGVWVCRHGERKRDDARTHAFNKLSSPLYTLHLGDMSPMSGGIWPYALGNVVIVEYAIHCA